MLNNKNKGTLHDMNTLPRDVDVPVYVDSNNKNEHIVVSVKGTIYSDGVIVPQNTFKYFGWGELCDDVRVVEYQENTGSIYQNGSTIEDVFADSNCTMKIGSLDRYEICDCLGRFLNRAIVRYNIDGTSNYKIGFVKWLGGIK